MMKRKILLILNMAIIGFSTAACSDDETNYITPEKKYPLTAFAVAINNVSANTTSYYHGKIDQTTHRVEIGTIEDANTITGVDYTLMSDGATISPDPATFVHNWKKEQHQRSVQHRTSNLQLSRLEHLRFRVERRQADFLRQWSGNFLLFEPETGE